jgi:hypothetical protein
MNSTGKLGWLLKLLSRAIIRADGVSMNPVVALAISGSVLMAQGGSSGEVRALHYSVVGETARLDIEVSREFEYQTNQLHNPERLYFDILDAKPGIVVRRSYSKKYAGEVVSRVRVGERAHNVTRVVLDLREPAKASISRLANPARLVIELRPDSLPPTRPVKDSSPIPAASSLPSVSNQKDPLARATVAATAEPIREAAQSVPISGHALNVSSASAGPGGVALAVISLSAPSGKEPLALQWELFYASPQLGLESEDLVIGGAAKSVGKSLTCTGRPESAGTYVYRCILGGGAERILSGPVALITFRVRATARLGPTSVRLGNVLGVNEDGIGVSIRESQADVIIR